ncbi:MAG: DNA topoisomerase 3 [Parachlamydiaceae bacterium]
MKVILAEKPSVARDIASVLGANQRHEGYFEGNGIQVTWAYGHLVSLKEPEDYDPALKKWTLATLPFVPKNFELKLVDQKGISKQFSVIKRLFKSAEEIICATDAGREGELIFRYILNLSGCTKKPFKRVWLSSLTEEAILNAFKTLKPGSQYDNLFAAARCRSESDWIVGLNATRNLTVRYGSGGHLWSVGRVQTPVLAMIVRRDDEIRTFIPEDFWELKTHYRKTLFKYKGERFKQEANATAVLQQISQHPLWIRAIESKEEKELPPLLYDLTELQREMNRKHGFSASDTLQVAQSLYESKYISYPRTDSRFLSQEITRAIPGILSRLRHLKSTEIAPLNLDHLPFNSRIVNDKKVGEHHALIPTGKSPGALDSRSQIIYEAILMRLICVFYPPCLKKLTCVDGEVQKIAFQAKGVQILHPGWTALYPKEGTKTKTPEEEQVLPAFIVGENGPHIPFVKACKTEPTRHYTESSLLGAMETAGKLIDDEHLREAMKQKGLGTPATRAAIIETLLKRNYMVRDKKMLIATHMGRYLIALIQDPQLKSPELTGEWECKLKEIEKGSLDPHLFMTSIVGYTTGLISTSDATSVDSSCWGCCPRCKRHIIEGKRGYGCSGWKEGCSFVLWKEYKGTFLQEGQIRLLLQRKILLQPFSFTEGDKVYLSLTETGSLVEIPVPTPSIYKKPFKKYKKR